jgi:hypothetical protein
MPPKNYPVQPCISIDGQMYTLDAYGALWNVNAIAAPGTMRRGDDPSWMTSQRAEIIDWRWNEDEHPSGRDVTNARHWLKGTTP